MEPVYMNSDHSSQLLFQMSELWHCDKYCDAILKLKDTTYKLHKLVLIAACPNILNLLDHREEGSILQVFLPLELDQVIVAQILDYFYAGTIQLRGDNIKKVEKLAKNLQIGSLIQHCKNFRTVYNLVDEDGQSADSGSLEDRDKGQNISRSLDAERMPSSSSGLSSGIQMKMEIESKEEMEVDLGTDKTQPETKLAKVKVERKFSLSADPSAEIGLLDPAYMPLSQYEHARITAFSADTDSPVSTHQETPSAMDSRHFSDIKSAELADSGTATAMTLTDSISNTMFTSYSKETSFGSKDNGQAVDLLSNSVMDSPDKILRLSNTRINSVEQGTMTEESPEVRTKRDAKTPMRKEHLNNVHSKGKKELCHLCSRGFAKRLDYHKHMFKLHQVPMPDKYTVYNCDECDFTAFSKFHVTLHKASHKDSRDHQCSKCSKTFKSLNAVKRHMVYHEKRSFPCEHDDCKYAAVSKSALTSHVKLKHTEKEIKPYQCKFCSYKCGIKGNFDKHIRLVHNLDVVTKYTLKDKQKYGNLKPGTIILKSGKYIDPSVTS